MCMCMYEYIYIITTSFWLSVCVRRNSLSASEMWPNCFQLKVVFLSIDGNLQKSTSTFFSKFFPQNRKMRNSSRNTRAIPSSPNPELVFIHHPELTFIHRPELFFIHSGTGFHLSLSIGFLPLSGTNSYLFRSGFSSAGTGFLPSSRNGFWCCVRNVYN